MTFTPDVFACGVDVVGISNLVSFYETVPPYWKSSVMPLFHKYVGDPRRPEDRRRMEAKSPLFKADQVERPLLIIHGARDIRVNVRESEQMITALNQAGKDVRSVVFPDEGDRKSTRLNSSHLVISYAVFCLKKKRACPAPGGPLYADSAPSQLP